MQTKTAQLFLVIILFLASSSIYSQPKNDNWNSYKFLLGEWIGEGSGAQGEAAGEFTFSTDLQNTILVRKSYAEYPAQSGRPAFRHDDLMIIYQINGAPKADYFDNKGHVIKYDVLFSSDPLSVIFISATSQTSPRFRLTYTKIDNGKMKFNFDIASPGAPDNFSKYIEGFVRKKQ